MYTPTINVDSYGSQGPGREKSLQDVNFLTRFEYKMTSEQNLVAEILAKQFWVFLITIQNKFFFKNTQTCFDHNSATKYHSEVVLHLKRTAGYPLSPHIKTIAVAFLRAE